MKKSAKKILLATLAMLAFIGSASKVFAEKGKEQGHCPLTTVNFCIQTDKEYVLGKWTPIS